MFPFSRKFRNSRKPAPKPIWLRWLVVGFFVYIIAAGYIFGDKKTLKTIEHAKEKIENHQTVNLRAYKDKIFPEYAAGLRIQDIDPAPGTSVPDGFPAVCGQRVALAYETYLAQGNKLPDSASHKEPLIFTIGEGKVMPVFENGVIGMKPGGKRSIIAPPLMSYGLEDYRREDVPKGATVRFELELLSAEPKLPDLDAMPYRIAEVAIGNNTMLTCGQPAHLRIKIWDLTGKELYSNTKDATPLVITPGKAEVMLGLEHGVIGMLEGGTRLLIIPPAFQKTLEGKKPLHTFPLPDSQTVMIEVEAHGTPQEPPQAGQKH